MIQAFWFIDFLGLFLGRLILSFFLFLEFRKKEKFISPIYLILSIFIFLGYFSSFSFLFLIFLETILLIKEIFFQKQKFNELQYRFLRIALAIVFLFVGPGLLSLDRMYNIRF
jgi:uncharacterized membrane protein YphA (DoxX/SURF4 family)